MKLIHANDWQYQDCIDPTALWDWLFDADMAGISGMKQLAQQRRQVAAISAYGMALDTEIREANANWWAGQIVGIWLMMGNVGEVSKERAA